MTVSIFLLNMGLGSAGAWFIYKFGSRLSLIDYPSERSSHRRATPKGGGIGISAALLVTCLFVGMPITFLLSSFIISFLGFYSDRKEILPKFRLFIQFMASIVFVSSIQFMQGNFVMNIIYIIIWSIFIVGTANFYNFMDGINGIAAITGIMAYGTLAMYLYLKGIHLHIVLLAACISFSCLGFLPFNMPHAKVFMGDIGSLLLGFVFATLVFVLSKELLDFICYVSLLFPFYIDGLNTMFFRFKSGDKLFQAHRKHLYQFIANEKGVSHWKISVLYGCLQLFIGITTLAMKPYGLFPVLTFLILCSIGFICIDFVVRSKLKKSIAS